MKAFAVDNELKLAEMYEIPCMGRKGCGKHIYAPASEFRYAGGTLLEITCPNCGTVVQGSVNDLSSSIVYVAVRKDDTTGKYVWKE